jgi:hypothetical protein
MSQYPNQTSQNRDWSRIKIREASSCTYRSTSEEFLTQLDHSLTVSVCELSLQHSNKRRGLRCSDTARSLASLELPRFQKKSMLAAAGNLRNCASSWTTDGGNDISSRVFAGMNRVAWRYCAPIDDSFENNAIASFPYKIYSVGCLMDPRVS